MYTCKDKIDKISEYDVYFINDRYFINRANNIECRDVMNNKLIFEIKSKKIVSTYKNLIVTNKLIIYNNDKLIYKNIDFENIWDGFIDNDVKLSIWREFDSNDSKLLWIHLFDISKMEFIYTNIILEGNVTHIKNNYLIIRKPQATLQIYDYTQSSVVWQKDFSEIATYNDPLHDTPMKGEISKVYLYKEDRIIVCTRYKSTYCFELTTGKQIWESKSYARTIEVVGEIGYVCTGLSLYKLNLETGERSDYYIESEGRMPDIIRGEDDIIWPAGHEVVYHDGLLWYSLCSSGYSYLIAINPFDGHYEWIHEVKTYEQTDSPKFYKNKMYIKDTGGTLHIYEKEIPTNTTNIYERKTS